MKHSEIGKYDQAPATPNPYTVAYYETCNSSYHLGHPLETLQVLVDRNTRTYNVRNALRENHTLEHLPEDYDTGLVRAAVDDWFKRYAAHPLKKWDHNLTDSMGDSEEYDCYAYFIIVRTEDELKD